MLYVAMGTFRPPFWNKGKPLSGPPLAPIRVQPFSLSGALVDTGREQAKRVVRNGKKETTTSPLCWTAGVGVAATARTFSIRFVLLAPIHSFATDDTRGIFLWWFFLLMTGISMILFYQMKQQASSQQLAAGFRPAMRQIASGGHCGVAECRAVRPYSV
ncbi:BnaC01g26890D [Brassica napus]|uniref:BnaC01g26890D protein n=1 Tax=Brassica napus TaxID=3708 RepID=A0A078FST2_BRANA|nr:BnaC01g26890D [Brassica napus]